MSNYLAEINATTFPTYFPPAKNFGSIGKIVSLILPTLLIGAGVIFFVMIVFAGFGYIQNSGNPEALKKTQDLLKYALIGFFIVLLAYFVVKLLTEIFNIQTPL